MDAGLIKLYSPAEVPRLKYISSLILGEMLGLQFEITHDKRRLGKHPVINYSDEKLPGAFNICPSGLLSEQGIKNYDPAVTLADF
ncbi:MAG: hypothetical protein MUE32_08585, partial [Bacteroidales bacterium]|nr:hypothetical protein [Bacteroidales bacterium]